MREFQEVALYARTEDEVGVKGSAVIPKDMWVASRAVEISVSIAYGGSVRVPSELIDFFGYLFDRLIGQQLVEVHGDTIAVPFRGRRKPDHYPVGDGAVNQRFSIARWKCSFLASENPVLDLLPNFAQERNLGPQPNQK